MEYIRFMRIKFLKSAWLLLNRGMYYSRIVYFITFLFMQGSVIQKRNY